MFYVMKNILDVIIYDTDTMFVQIMRYRYVWSKLPHGSNIFPHDAILLNM